MAIKPYNYDGTNTAITPSSGGGRLKPFVYSETQQVEQKKEEEKKPFSLGKFLKDVAIEAVKLPIRAALNVRETYESARLLGDVFDEKAYNERKAKQDERISKGIDSPTFGNLRPIGNTGKGFGADLKDTIGAGLEASSYIPIAKIPSLVSKSLGQSALRTAGQFAKEGVIAGGLGGAGHELQNPDSTVGSIAKSTAIGSATGGVLGGVLGGATGAISKTLSKKIKPFDYSKVTETSATPTVTERPNAADITSTYYRDVVAPSIKSDKATVIGSDNIKEHFNNDFAVENHPAYSVAARDTYYQAVKDDPVSTVRLTSGGPGAGKTDFVLSEATKDFKGVVFDSTLSDYKTAVDRINAAKEAGKNVEIYAVAPDVATTRYFALKRAQEIGRDVPSDFHSKAHTGAPDTLARLIENGVVDASDVHLIDTKGLTTREAVLAKIQQGYEKNPLAILRDKVYNESNVKQATTAGEQRFAQDNISRGGSKPVQSPSTIGANKGGNNDTGGSKSVLRSEITTSPKPIAVNTNEALASRVFKRLQAEDPSIEGDLNYNPIKLKEDAEKAVNLIAKDRQKAFDIAMGKETSSDVTSTAVNIAMAEKALNEGNTALYSRLIKNRSLEQTRRGQEIVAEKASITDNSTSRYVKELIGLRLEKLGNTYLSDLKDVTKRTSTKQKGTNQIEKEVQKVQRQIKDKKLTMQDARQLLDALSCV